MAKEFEDYGKYIRENRGNPQPITAEELKKKAEDKKESNGKR